MQATLQQPYPNAPKRPYASFLTRFVDPVELDPRPFPYPGVLKWLESVGSDREEQCRSNSEPFSRRLTRSAPEIYERANWVSEPPYQAPHSESFTPVYTSTATNPSSVMSLLQDPLYRVFNLASNNIYMRQNHDEFPEDIANLIEVVSKGRNSPPPSPDQLRRDPELAQFETKRHSESMVEEYFKDGILSGFKQWDSLARTDRFPMASHTVPNIGSQNTISKPVPDILYGYRYPEAFPQQGRQLTSMGTQLKANSQGLLYPFLVIEFKGSGGDLWVATNQCLGGSTACVSMAERLNEQLRQCTSHEVQTINSAAFSIAMSGTEARLYISWKHDELVYYMQKIRGFYLQDPEQYITFRKYVRNIIDWGKDERLEEIRKSLDSLWKENIRNSL